MLYAYVFQLLALLILGGSWPDRAEAKPFASDLFCQSFPDSPSCSGKAISCGYCHQSVPPTVNSFGGCFIKAMKEKGGAYPESSGDMASLVRSFGKDDCDGDGVSNIAEIDAGTLPGDARSTPSPSLCSKNGANLSNPYYKLCKYDYNFAYKRVWQDVCGEPPTYEEYLAFTRLGDQAKSAELGRLLDKCVDSNHWLGKDGIIWEIGHYKIRPIGSIKLGEDEGLLGIVDYYTDFNLFVYTQIDGHDAREVLLADYMVTRSAGRDTTRYSKQSPSRLADGNLMQTDKRVGLITTFWNLGFYLNYTGIARVLVAQAFIAYAGITLSEMEGLNPPDTADSKFKDYDGKGVERPECAQCHTTVDALAYPFRNYNGLTGTSAVLQGQNAAVTLDALGDEENLSPLSYSLRRMEELDLVYPGIRNTPEAGYIFGKRVESLKEWAEVMVNSDQFAANTVRDYWRVLVGHDPRPEEAKEFQKLWKDFKDVHDFDVEKMLHDLIKTEAYGVP